MQVLAALADPTRRRIVELLANGEMAAGEVAGHFILSRAAVSQHLQHLLDAGLVRCARWVSGGSTPSTCPA
jgi:DNA-binding transcriptional ArsR family regulator